LIKSTELLPGEKLSPSFPVVFRSEQNSVDIFVKYNSGVVKMRRIDAGDPIDWVFEPQEPPE